MKKKKRFKKYEINMQFLTKREMLNGMFQFNNISKDFKIGRGRSVTKKKI